MTAIISRRRMLGRLVMSATAVLCLQPERQRYFIAADRNRMTFGEIHSCYVTTSKDRRLMLMPMKGHPWRIEPRNYFMEITEEEFNNLAV